MTIRVLAITEPSTHPENDATVALYRELAARTTFDFYHTAVGEITTSGQFRVCHLPTVPSYAEFLCLNEGLNLEMKVDDFDCLIDRADKPVPNDYYRILGTFEERIQFINRPSAVDYAGTKGSLRDLVREYMVDSIFTREVEEAVEFYKMHGTLVAKQNLNQGGKGVFKVWGNHNQVCVENVSQGVSNFSSPERAFASIFATSSDKFLLCRFVRNIQAGDKRVIVLDGLVIGAYLRQSQKSGGWLHNTSSGGRALATQVTAGENRIIESTFKKYRDIGIHFLGYDFLMDGPDNPVLSEVNCANLGGINFAQELGYPKIFDQLLSWLEVKVRERGLYDQ